MQDGGSINRTLAQSIAPGERIKAGLKRYTLGKKSTSLSTWVPKIAKGFTTTKVHLNGGKQGIEANKNLDQNVAFPNSVFFSLKKKKLHNAPGPRRDLGPLQKPR